MHKRERCSPARARRRRVRRDPAKRYRQSVRRSRKRVGSLGDVKCAAGAAFSPAGGAVILRTLARVRVGDAAIQAVARARSSTIAFNATVRQRLAGGVAPTRPLWAALVPGVRSVGRSGSGRIRRASLGHRLHGSRAFAMFVRGREANAEPLRRTFSRSAMGK